MKAPTSPPGPNELRSRDIERGRATFAAAEQDCVGMAARSSRGRLRAAF